MACEPTYSYRREQAEYKFQNSKSEARNPKQIRIFKFSNVQNEGDDLNKTGLREDGVLGIGIWVI
jgi:hypothetical protein